jgi:hypothetical protein
MVLQGQRKTKGEAGISLTKVSGSRTSCSSYMVFILLGVQMKEELNAERRRTTQPLIRENSSFSPKKTKKQKNSSIKQKPAQSGGIEQPRGV